MLALGASRLEATRGLLQDAVATALTPVLNQMAVIGLVSIPGMMTGQILGGSTPEKVEAACCCGIFVIMNQCSLAARCGCAGKQALKLSRNDCICLEAQSSRLAICHLLVGRVLVSQQSTSSSSCITCLAS